MTGYKLFIRIISDYGRFIFGLIFLLLISAVVMTQEVRQTSDEKKINCVKMKSSDFRDGKYIGEVKIWPEIKVEVVVQQGKIFQISILEDFGTPEFSEMVFGVLPDSIVANNSVDVDGISGATLSSNHLKKAVRIALDQAKKTESD